MVTKYRQLENIIYLFKDSADIDKQINSYISELKTELTQLLKLGHNAVKVETKLNVKLSAQEQQLVDDMMSRKI